MTITVIVILSSTYLVLEKSATIDMASSDAVLSRSVSGRAKSTEDGLLMAIEYLAGVSPLSYKQSKE